MSRKQEIYQEILATTLPLLRNLTSWGWWHRLFGRTAYKGAFHEAELVHNLTHSMFDPEFVEHDIWFLNFQARRYFEECNAQLSPFYPARLKLLRELFLLVPDHLRQNLQWSGPRDCAG